MSPSAFGSVIANRHISFDVRFGEVHALVGENGAGKSTLMSIVAGSLPPRDRPTPRLRPTPRFRSPRDAIAAGIGMVYQHFMLVETMTVAENMLLGLPAAPFALDTSAIGDRLRGLSATDSASTSIPMPTSGNSRSASNNGSRSCACSSAKRHILVLDEPTAVLTPLEADRLIATVRAMAADGYAIIFISHKLDEVLRVADRITVLRRGRSVATSMPPGPIATISPA